MADEHLCALQYGVTALDFAGEVELRAEIDGTIENPCTLAPTVIGLRHWRAAGYGHRGLKPPQDPQTAYLHLRTRVSQAEVAVAMHLAVEGIPQAGYTSRDCAHAPGVAARFRLGRGETAVATKRVICYTSHEAADPLPAALEGLQAATGRSYSALLRDHRAIWRALWHDCDLVIEGDLAIQRAVRFNLYQLLIAVPRHSDRVSIPAKTLSGFGYRGHVFWDTEIFILPFFAFTRPELARNLLMYRYHTLPGARENARQAGYEGAMYAWESAADGRETTPPWVPLPGGGLVRIWCGEIEQHITADVAYAVWQYWQVTGDDDFMRDYGAEIVLDTASFWGSRVEYDAAAGRYEINDVIGPDEYHEHVNNNAYTNRLVQWHLEKALELVSWLRDRYPLQASILQERLGLSEERLAHWRDVRRRLYIPYDQATGLFEQFDGFFQLRDIDWQALEPRTRSIQEVLGIEPTQKVQAIKQGDVLMLLYLLRGEYDERVKRANWGYYEPRTDHTYGSSLGPAVHAVMGIGLDHLEDAYEHFVRAAFVDLDDLRGNTRDGIHAASAGGVWQVVVMGFAGLGIGPEGLTFAPRLPDGWQRLRFTVRYHGEPVAVDLKRTP
jgi:kojibiose phosphorylase